MTAVAIKDLRNNLSHITDLVQQGQSFSVFRRSKMCFKIIPVDAEEEWETVMDFTEIHKDGVKIEEVLSALKFLDK